MSIQIQFRIEFLVDFGTDFAAILNAKPALAARVGDPSFGVGALEAPKSEIKSFRPIFNPLRHRFRSDFPSLIFSLSPNTFASKPRVYFRPIAQKSRKADNQAPPDKPP